ncbi:MAG: response regulator [Deltaproteobacteria bacterium]|nr:MAG: response regulator [Deltaproteobacteria bacterium]
MRCLIIDDDESPRTLMARIVTDAGHRAIAVASGDAAMAALRDHGFDVALVDMEMPGMDGADTIARLRRLAPGLRVLVVSGYEDRRHVMSAFEAGADGYLLKDELHESLRKSLDAVRAGHAPLSPRVAAVVLKQVRRRAGSEPPPTHERVREALGLGRPIARLRKNPRLGAGTGSHGSIDAGDAGGDGDGGDGPAR